MIFRSEIWLQAVRDLGYCVRCGCICQPDACHMNEGKGAGMKQHDCMTFAGCRKCHMELDQGKDMDREERRAEIRRLVILTWIALAERGFFDDLAKHERKYKSSSKILPRKAA